MKRIIFVAMQDRNTKLKRIKDQDYSKCCLLNVRWWSHHVSSLRYPVHCAHWEICQKKPEMYLTPHLKQHHKITDIPHTIHAGLNYSYELAPDT